MSRSYGSSRFFFLILAIAIFVRLLCYIVLQDRVYVTDDFVMRYDQIADHLLTSKGFSVDTGRPASNSAPLYPFALAGLYFIFGHSLLAVSLFSILIDAAAAALIAVCAKEVFESSKVGFWAGIVASFHPTFVYSSLTVGNEPVFLLFHAASLLLLIKAFKSAKPAGFAMAGVCLGIATLGRAVTMLLPLWLLPLFIFRMKINKQAVCCYLAFVTSVYLVMAPWTYRNMKVFNMFMPVQSVGGLNFYLGTFPPDNMAEKGYSLGLSEAMSHEAFKGESYSFEKKDKMLFRLALLKIFANPYDYIKTLITRLGTMWFADFFGRFSIKHLLASGTLLVLFLPGLFIATNRLYSQEVLKESHTFLLLTGGFILYHILLALIMVSDSRFTVPAQQMMFPVAGFFLAWCHERFVHFFRLRL